MSGKQTKNPRISGDGQPLGVLLSEHKKGYARKIYKAESDKHKSEALQNDIRGKSALLYAANERQAVNFNDLEDVQNRTRKYLEACAASGTFPSMMGLAAYGFGVSRQAVYWHLKHNPDAPSSKFIDRVRDLIADVLSSAALMRNADNVTTIFILKNGLGFSDRLEVEPVTNHEPEQTYDKTELLKRYLIEN